MYPMWNIIKLPNQSVHVDLWLKDKDNIIWSIKSIIYLCRLTGASWIPLLRTYGSELGWALGFELGLSDGMVLGAIFQSSIGYSINMFPVLEICHYFGTWEGYLVGFSIGRMAGLMIGTGEWFWLAYHWDFYLNPYMTLQILEMRFLACY